MNKVKITKRKHSIFEMYRSLSLGWSVIEYTEQNLTRVIYNKIHGLRNIRWINYQ